MQDLYSSGEDKVYLCGTVTDRKQADLGPGHSEGEGSGMQLWESPGTVDLHWG